MTATGSQAEGDSDLRSAAKRLRHVQVVAAVTALGGMLFGYDTGVISGALLFVRQSFHLTTFEAELVTSAILVGAMVGAFGSGRLAGAVGRRPVILATALLFIAGVLLAAFSTGMAMLVLARFAIGVAVGSASMLVPMYISELAPPRIRGSLVSLNQLAITSGILMAGLVDYGLSSSGNWRLMFGLAVIPAAALFLGVLFQPESPHWLITKGREEEARRILLQVRDRTSIDDEVAQVRQLSNRRTSLAELWLPAVRPALMLGVGLAVLQQVTGINTVIYYAPSLLKGAGLTAGASILATVGVGIINVGMTVVAIRLLDRTGRRPLLIGGTAGMAISLAVVAVAFTNGSQLKGLWAVMAVGAIMVYVGSFAVGLGPVFWLMISEIYPLKVRGEAMSVATMANWGANLVVSLTFLSLIGALGAVGTFALFAVVTVGAVWYFFARVPETKGRSLAEIERDLDRSGLVQHKAAPGAAA
ncbi:MAG: sugar porter family MFS transporter [Actinomycetota bacterium]|nr:sugar porter family MFS transporter [Actinomycetota bacterium]